MVAHYPPHLATIHQGWIRSTPSPMTPPQRTVLAADGDLSQAGHGRSRRPWGYGEADRLSGTPRGARFAMPYPASAEAGERAFVTIAAVAFSSTDREGAARIAMLTRTLMTKHRAIGGSARERHALIRFTVPSAAVEFAGELVADCAQAGIAARVAVHSGWMGTNEAGQNRDDAGEVARKLLTRTAPGAVVASQAVRDLTIGAPFRWIAMAGSDRAPETPELPTYQLCSGDEVLPAATSEPGRHPATHRLSPRERQVAVLLAKGLTNRAVAKELSISAATVERHVTNILSKLAFRSRAQIAAWSIQHGLAELSIA